MTDFQHSSPPAGIRVVAVADMRTSNFSRELEGKDMGHPGVSLILVEAEPGRGPSLHTHDYAEVMILLEGEATFTDGTGSRRVTAGHVVVVPAGQPHAFTNTGTGRLKQVDIHVADAYGTDWL
jgi:mannose-6-phosphate isomerase-like protein (cupin superfamily)